MEWPAIGYDENEMTPEAKDLINKLLELDPKKRLGSNGINEIKDHKFFVGIKWDQIMDEPVPFVPGGRDIDATNFPNANANDEELKQIVSDKRHQQPLHKDFNNFDGVCYGTLQSINAKEAKKAIIRA